jgi:hypothetical protein
VTVPKKSCKHVGGESSYLHFSENRSEVQSLPLNKETFQRNDQEVTGLTVGPSDDYIEPPFELDVDGDTFEYGILEEG